jgi:hypothetical protein
MNSKIEITVDKSQPFQFNLARSLARAEPVAICQCLQTLTWRQVLSTILYFTSYSSTDKDTWSFNISLLAQVNPMDFIRYYKSLNERSSFVISNKLKNALSYYPIKVDCWSIRRKSLCRGHNCMILDYDDIDRFMPDLKTKLIEFIDSYKLNYIRYDTFSGNGKFRLLLPLNNVVNYSTYKRCASVLLYLLGPVRNFGF